MTKIGFIGAGIVGTALAVRLSNKGYPIVAVSSRSMESAKRLSAQVLGCLAYSDPQEVVNKSDLIFVTTPDDAILKVVSQLIWRTGKSVVHCSGVDSLLSLEPARWAGAGVGSFHPLQTFASVSQAINNLPGSMFALESDEPLLTTLKELAAALDGKWVVLKGNDKVLYHAAAVMACNYMVTLMKMAGDLWESFGSTQEEAVKALMPLLRGTVNNIDNVGLPNCLTGPIARGDIGTVTKHLNALKDTTPDLLLVYCELGLKTLHIAQAKGKIGREQADAIKDLFKRSLEKTAQVMVQP